MLQKVKRLLKDTYVYRMTIVWLFLFFVCFVVFIIKWKSLPPQLPLYYSLPRSEAQLGSPSELFFLFLFSALFFLLNFLISSLLNFESKVPVYILIGAGVFVSFMFLISFLKIVFLVA